MGDRLGTPGAVGFLRFLKQIYFYSFHTTLASLHCTEVPFQTFYLILTHSWVTTVNEKEKKKCRNMFCLRWTFGPSPCQRPYHVEHTSSRPITEVKQHWARIVLGWETAWELLVLLAFFYFEFVWKLKKYNFFSNWHLSCKTKQKLLLKLGQWRVSLQTLILWNFKNQQNNLYIFI